MEIARTVARDAGHAEEALRPFFAALKLGSAASRPFSFELAGYASSGAELIEYSWDAPTVHGEGEFGGSAVLQVRLDGRLGRGREIVDTSRPLLFADPLWVEATKVEARIIRFDTDALNRVARSSLGDDSFELKAKQRAPITREHAALWTRASDFVAESYRNGEADDPMLGLMLNEFLMHAYLHFFPSNWSEAVSASGERTGLPATVRRAREFIDANSARPISVMDIADAAGISLRGLQAAFRRDLDLTPGEYLRRVRLESARRSLQAAGPGEGVTVAAVARAAGFAHPSRFAAAYAEAFGELPSQTLRY